MLARFFEVANVCLSIMIEPAPTSSLARPVKSIPDYSTALASFRRDFPRV